VPVPQFEVAAKRRGPRAVVSASGELDIATAPQLSAVVALAMGSRPDELCIDLTALTFIDSTGLNVLCQANDRYDGRLVIICPPGNVRRVFDKRFTARIEEIVGRKVHSFVSALDPDKALAYEIFVFEPAG
jgi:anti-anti-sigma factor